jgi:hypothetical protein
MPILAGVPRRQALCKDQDFARLAVCAGAATKLVALLKNPGWITLKGKGLAALALKNIGHHQRAIGEARMFVLLTPPVTFAASHIRSSDVQLSNSFRRVRPTCRDRRSGRRLEEDRG